MDKKIKHISQEIIGGRLLEENIPVLFNYLADHYEMLAQVQLAMHYDTFYEACYDNEITLSPETSMLITRINEVIRDGVLKNQSGLEREKAVKDVDAIRKEITRHMNVLLTYTDIFKNYEYILNRLEYRFNEDAQTMDEEEFSKEILRFIFDSEDNLIINEKIKDMIGQLPIRITKQKYFDIIKKSIGAYLGADGSSLDNFLYLLRTSAMLYHAEGMEAQYPELWEKKEYLSSLDFQNITRDGFDKAENVLKEAVQLLETETNQYFGLQELTNKAYVLLLCSPYSGMIPLAMEDIRETAVSIINDINAGFFADKMPDISDRMIERLTQLEGVQETLAVELKIMEDALSKVSRDDKALIKSLMLDQFLQVLNRSQKLLSDSLFIELEDAQEEAMVDEKRIAEETSALVDELSKLLAKCDRMISHAVMANTISKVPVFFNDHKEVMDYVRYSLQRCSDRYEKAACAEIITDLMKG